MKNHIVKEKLFYLTFFVSSGNQIKLHAKTFQLQKFICTSPDGIPRARHIIPKLHQFSVSFWSQTRPQLSKLYPEYHIIHWWRIGEGVTTHAAWITTEYCISRNLRDASRYPATVAPPSGILSPAILRDSLGSRHRAAPFFEKLYSIRSIRRFRSFLVFKVRQSAEGVHWVRSRTSIVVIEFWLSFRVVFVILYCFIFFSLFLLDKN